VPYKGAADPEESTKDEPIEVDCTTDYWYALAGALWVLGKVEILRVRM